MVSSPKYLKKKTNVENQFSTPRNKSPSEDTVVNVFVESRKGRGKRQARALSYFLYSACTLPKLRAEYLDEPEWEWVSFAEIEKYMQESCSISRNRLAQLLKDMEKVHIIRKKTVIDSKLQTPNKERTFYRFQPQAFWLVKNDEWYKREYIRLSLERDNLSVEINELLRRFDSAMNILNKNCLLQEYYKDYFSARSRTGFLRISEKEIIE